ncbi:MAG: hypothetical protein JWM71_2574, partial [Solirubrobacteraceae bacterium]|nr:hypothetical protein [Solirubrobacteraceae bacterium]
MLAPMLRRLAPISAIVVLVLAATAAASPARGSSCAHPFRWHLAHAASTGKGGGGVLRH